MKRQQRICNGNGYGARYYPAGNYLPGAGTVQCASSVPAPNIAQVTASDNCSAVISFVNDVISNQTAPNKYTITRTYKATDPSGNSATCCRSITVNDNTAPSLIVAGSLPGNANGQCVEGAPFCTIGGKHRCFVWG